MQQNTIVVSYTHAKNLVLHETSREYIWLRSMIQQLHSCEKLTFYLMEIVQLTIHVKFVKKDLGSILT